MPPKRYRVTKRDDLTSPSSAPPTWESVFGVSPPRDLSPELQRLALVWREQERLHGGLSEEAWLRIADLQRGLAADPNYRLRPTGDLVPGSALVREWKGHKHVVYVLDDAFVWEGRTYRSMTAVARAITGTHWSGPTFFGRYETPRKRARAAT